MSEPIYLLQRRRDRYTAIYVWKIMEEIVPNLSPPMCMNVSERRGRLCVLKSVERGHIGTLAHSSFRWRGARIFNALPLVLYLRLLNRFSNNSLMLLNVVCCIILYSD